MSQLGRAAQVALGSQADTGLQVELQAAASYVSLPRHRKTRPAPPQPPFPSTAFSCWRAGRGQPALPLDPGRRHPAARPEHPESHCLSATTAGIQGWISWSPLPLYTAVLTPLAQKGTPRGRHPLAVPPAAVHSVSQQAHERHIPLPALSGAASLLPA